MIPRMYPLSQLKGGRGLMFCGHEVKNDMLNGETNNMTMHMHR